MQKYKLKKQYIFVHQDVGGQFVHPLSQSIGEHYDAVYFKQYLRIQYTLLYASTQISETYM